MRVVVLGGGMVGRAIARDLARNGEFEVGVVDNAEAVLAGLAGEAGIATERADLRDPANVARVVRNADLVVGAVPGFMGFATLAAVIEAGKNVVDISFFPEDPFRLDAQACSRGVVAVVDCGIAPGCSNLILGRMESEFTTLERFVCFVGGLPVVRSWPWEYKAPFSPIDVLEEYTRPARYVADGRVVTMPALSEPELVEFAGVGTLEAFNTDGLRSLLSTSRVPFMLEKTLRYPGHIDKIRVLRDSGFLGLAPVEVAGAQVRPVDMTARLLFTSWAMAEDEADLTVMRVIVEGALGGRRVRRTLEMLDKHDPATHTSSMARTTGYTCTAGVRLLAGGLYRRPGITPPELLGRQGPCYDFMMADLGRRGVVFSEVLQEVPAV
jgi:saccharopine dehydrogenase-like NADP-dependent oxidoreductase